MQAMNESINADIERKNWWINRCKQWMNQLMQTMNESLNASNEWIIKCMNEWIIKWILTDSRIMFFSYQLFECDDLLNEYMQTLAVNEWIN